MNEEHSQKQGLEENQEQVTNILQQYSNLIQQHPEIANTLNNNMVLQNFIQNTQVEANPEKRRISDRLSGFDVKDNIAWKEITRRFGSNIKQPELLSIANVLANYANIRLDRDAKRRKSVLIKWFNENWAAISGYLNHVVLEDSTQQS
ncbi:hypothetical protein GPJ56_001301 [Histomonas meleagridis]|uniref:uncharacterized protein n=1 Tax=Histomonas meleagridis TaxID=135588 RepID=UPI003559C748|nr:hypothetical protein GPJ56_001301 [Histomonas meleagridis]KAH0805058.1 hypothetical protein GO595_002003 [Histomonas meleagridis]